MVQSGHYQNKFRMFGLCAVDARSVEVLGRGWDGEWYNSGTGGEGRLCNSVNSLFTGS